MSTIDIVTTRRGGAAMWEEGGGLTSGGTATVIAGRNGEELRPVYVLRGGHLACGKHALIGVYDGFHIVRVDVSRGDLCRATISRILSVAIRAIGEERWEATADVEEVNAFSEGEWDKPLAEMFGPAVAAAFRKAATYHCRTPFFVVDDQAKPASTS